MVNLIAFLCGLVFNGQFATVQYKGAVKLNKGGRKGIAPNPLFGRVTRSAVCQIRLIPYVTSREKLDGTERSDPVGPLWGGQGVHLSPLVVEHKGNGNKYIMCDSTLAKVLSYEYLVDGKPANEEELATIRQYKPEREDSSVFMLNIEDVVSVKASGQTVIA
jgi:hypothetical protein